MYVRALTVALLLFGSGLCALMYQIVWLRELRLVFGASTAAHAAVLAIFMAGLGVGNVVLGKRSDRVRNPLRFYAGLELAITAAAFISPFLIGAVRHIYIALGGGGGHGLAGRNGRPPGVCDRRPRHSDVSDGWHVARGGAGGHARRRP